MKNANLMLALSAALALIVAGCMKSNEDGEVEVGRVTVDHLATGLSKGESTVLDANGPSTRKQFGVIPGATLLSHFKDYQLSELPADKGSRLVFYCTNESCGASHAAAEVAYHAGYRDVHVLPAGIAGWKKAGQRTHIVQ